MYSIVNTTFSEWLTEQMVVRDWTQADLARATGLSRGTVSNLLNNVRSPGSDVLRSIAKGLNLPPETVYRTAGLLPKKPAIDEQIEEIMYEAAQLTEAEREELLAYIRMKRNLREKR